MIELFTGSLLSLGSLLIGYSLGKNQRLIPEQTQKRINEIFTRVVPKSDVGPIERPTVQQNFYRDNPRAAIENEVMAQQFGELMSK